MTDFKAKMHQIRFRLGICSPDPIAGFGDRFAAEGRGWAGEGEGKGREREGKGECRGGKGRAPKLLLNQGPSEPCYATAHSDPLHCESNKNTHANYSA